MFYPTTCVGFRYGPIPHQASGAVFLGSLLLGGYLSRQAARVLSGLAPRVSAARSGYTVQRAIPSARTPFAPPSPLGLRETGLRNIDRMSIHMAYKACVRSRLTLNRLALFRNPWSFGEGVSRPLCRYLYLHLLFRNLQRLSRDAFSGGGMLPYQSTLQ